MPDPEDKIEKIIFKEKIILIDKEDLVLLEGWRLELHKPNAKSKEYVRLRKGGHKTYKQIYLHRLIMNASRGVIIDHINQNPLDNRRCNLRIANKSQNGANSKERPRRKHKLPRGVMPKKEKFAAYIHVNWKKISLGIFNSAEEAGEAYLKAREFYFGEFAPKISNKGFLNGQF